MTHPTRKKRKCSNCKNFKPHGIIKIDDYGKCAVCGKEVVQKNRSGLKEQIIKIMFYNDRYSFDDRVGDLLSLFEKYMKKCVPKRHVCEDILTCTCSYNYCRDKTLLALSKLLGK